MSMLGCRPLEQTEIDQILNGLKTTRDKTLFMTMLYTGFRIKEVLTVKVRDALLARLTVVRKNMKGKQSSRSVLIHPIVKDYILKLIKEENLSQDDFLFTSKKSGAISRVQAWRIINAVVKSLGLEGKIALHSTRKTFADRMYTKLGKDLIKTSKALGHKNINSTVSYLSFRTEEFDEAILDFDEVKNAVD